MSVEQCFRHTCGRCGHVVQTEWAHPTIDPRGLEAHPGYRLKGWETVTVGPFMDSRHVYMCPDCVAAMEVIKGMFVDNRELSVTDDGGATTTFDCRSGA